MRRAALASPRSGCKPRDAAENPRVISGQRAEADRAASRERAVSGGIGLVPGTFSFGEKLLPLFHLSRKLGLCLGEKEPPCSTSSRPGAALCVVFLCRPGFTSQQRLGAGCLPRRCREPVPFSRCYFSARPGVQESLAAPGWSGARGRPGASLRGAGQRGLRRPPSRSQPAFSSAAARQLPETSSPSPQRREQAFCTRETSCSSDRLKERRKFN